MPRILVVDDDVTIRAMFSRALSKLGEVEVAAGGEEALQLLEVKKFDAITLDLAMPRVDGFGVLARLGAKEAKNHSTPVVVVTANPQDQAMSKSFHAGAVLFLTKPVSILQLGAMVSMALSQAAHLKK
jgi:CheY-like chemotaxis protein